MKEEKNWFYSNKFPINYKMTNHLLQKHLVMPELKLEKLETSVNTATTSNNCFTIKPSLLNCCSSISLEEPERYTHSKYERKLFLSFLSSSTHPSAHVKLLNCLRECYTKNIQQRERGLFSFSIPPIQILPSHYSPNLTETLEHYCGAWLVQMGYKTEKNKQMIIQKARLVIPDDQIYVAVLFYELFGAHLISPTERWELILSTCQNGWEHFIVKLLQFWKINRQQLINSFPNRCANGF